MGILPGLYSRECLSICCQKISCEGNDLLGGPDICGCIYSCINTGNKSYMSYDIHHSNTFSGSRYFLWFYWEFAPIRSFWACRHLNFFAFRNFSDELTAHNFVIFFNRVIQGLTLHNVDITVLLLNIYT